MKGIGRKIGKSFKQVGVKSGKAFRTVGKKFDTAVHKTDKFIDKSIHDVNKFSDKVIKNSGKMTDGIRVGSKILDKVVGVANTIGGDIPIVGSALGVANAATGQLRKGAKYIDDNRDRVAAAKRDAVRHIQLEKNNLRKKAEQKAAEAVGNIKSNFV